MIEPRTWVLYVCGVCGTHRDKPLTRRWHTRPCPRLGQLDYQGKSVEVVSLDEAVEALRAERHEDGSTIAGFDSAADFIESRFGGRDGT